MSRGRPNQGAKLVALQKKGWRERIWYIRWSEGGRSRERTTGTSERGAADQIFARWLLEQGRNIESIGPRYPAEIPIADMLALYCEKRAPDTADPARIGQCVKRLLDWWGDRRVDAVRPETCRQYRQRRVADGAKIATAGKELSVLRAALIYAVKNGYLVSAPFVELPPKQPPKDRWLTHSEAARLLWESRKSTRSRLHLPLFILIALYTGARQGAILGLRWSQVDLVRGQIDFNEPGRARNNKRRAMIPIPRGLRLALARAHRRASMPYVVSYHGKPVRNVSKAFRAACKRAGITGVTRHTLRHTCGTWMAMRGVPLWEIGGWLGHSNERTTELYAHHHPDFQANAKRALERK